MKIKIIIVIFILFSNLKVVSQFPIPYKDIDSIFQTNIVSDYDWAIGLSIIDQAGSIPLMDSLGNVIDEPILGTFLLFKIGNKFYLQKGWSDYSGNKIEPDIIFGTRIELNNLIGLNYISDSIQLAGNEWIYPYIYKNDSLSIFDVQPPANHEPYYSMYFKTKKTEIYIRSFTETSLTENKWFLNSKNLNYNYNLKTFIYRSFVKLMELVSKNKNAVAS